MKRHICSVYSWTLVDVYVCVCGRCPAALTCFIFIIFICLFHLIWCLLCWAETFLTLTPAEQNRQFPGGETLLFSDVFLCCVFVVCLLCVCCAFVVVSPQRPANNDGVSGKTSSSLFAAFMSQLTFPTTSCLWSSARSSLVPSEVFSL